MVGQRVDDIINECGENCCCKRYLSEIKNLLENICEEETTNEERSIFYELSMRHTKSFFLYDEINKKFGAEIFHLHDTYLKAAAFFEMEKIKKYLKTFYDIEKLERFLYVLSKSSVWFF